MRYDIKKSGKWWRDGSPRTVGSIGSAEALCHPNIMDAKCDIVEIRIDLLLADGLAEQEIMDLWPDRPVLLTVRCPSEEGAGNLDNNQRLSLYHSFLPKSLAVDIELAHLSDLSEIVDLAHKLGICLIGSAHNFANIPDESWLAEKAQQLSSRIDIVKIAGKVETLNHIERLTDWGVKLKRPFSIMGMGPLGPLSRVYAAQKGSALNYGFIGKNTAPGQWSSELLMQAIFSSEKI